MREESFREAIADFALPLPHLRFGVYRNNVSAALVNALRVRYPAAAAALGPLFGELTADYALRNLPQSPVLIDYGGSYPEFLANLAARHGMPWLGDLARLESLWWRAYHAAEQEPADPGRLLGLAPEALAGLRFTFHPSAALLQSSFAVGTIWEALRGGDAVPAVVAAPQRLMVARPEADVTVHILTPESFAFLSGLMAGGTLGGTFESCAAEFPAFDLQGEVAALLTYRIVTGA